MTRIPLTMTVLAVSIGVALLAAFAVSITPPSTFLSLAHAQASPSVAIDLSSASVTEGTAITVTMSFSNLAEDSDRATTDYIFRADVKDSENGDADGCEDQAGGYGLGVDRKINLVDEDPEVRKGTISAGCPAGDYTVRASISDANGGELASATAVRKGTISAGCPAGDYTVRASISDSNGGELASATADFSVAAPEPPPSTDAALKDLTLSGVTLEFDPATTTYTAEVGNDLAETTVTPTVNDDGATYVVRLDGAADEDGTVPLAVGENVISVVVTAEDGETTRTYTVTVTRAETPMERSTDAALSSLALSGVTLAFDSATTAYAGEVGNDLAETTVTPTVNDDGATYAVRLDGAADDDGTVPLAVGENVISILVTAEDDETTRTYTVTVTRAEAPPERSTDAALSSLTLSGVTLEFDPATTTYAAEVGNDLAETTVAPTVNDDGATYAVRLDGAADDDGTVPLAVGENVISILVTAEDDETTRTYTVTVTRAEAPPGRSTDAALSSLTLSGVTLEFDPATTTYAAEVGNDLAETTVAPTVNDDGATYAVRLDGAADDDGTVPLAVGGNVITIEVTAEDRETTRTYTVTVTRAEAPPKLSDDATLSSLTLSGVTLAFDPATTRYTASVGNDVTETTVTPAVNHDRATYAIKLDGTADADGVIPLTVGANAISIEVTAEDGETTRTYTVTVTRAPVPPATPVRPTGQSTGEGTVSLDWNDVPPATSYDVRYWQVDAYTELSADAGVNGISIAFNGSGATMRGLPTDYEWYYFEVRAVNDAGASGWSLNNAIQVPKDEQIAAPDAPDQPDGRLTGEGAVSLDWNDVPTATSYVVGVWLDSGWTELSAAAGVQGVSITFNGSGATVRGLPTDYEWYYFVVRAVNAVGTSDWSEHNAIQVQ